MVRVQLLPRQSLDEIICFVSPAESGLDGLLHLGDPLDDGAVTASIAAPGAAPRRPQHGRHHGPEVAVGAFCALQRAENDRNPWDR